MPAPVLTPSTADHVPVRRPATAVGLGLTLALALVASVLVVGLVEARSAPARTTLSAIDAPAVTPPPTTAVPTQDPTPVATLPLHRHNEVVSSVPWYSWAVLDRRTGQTWGSPNADEESRTASMVKAWLAALYLREHPQPSAEWLRTLSVMIRDSNNAAADLTHRALGGNRPVTDAMWSLCGVTAHIPSGRWWASTTISARQQALLGACIADGRVASPEWTAWVLNEMRLVRGGGDFGIRWAFPDDVRPTIAIKNGWTSGWGTGWYVNCMGIGDTWVLVIETRGWSLRAGMNACYDITAQLLVEPPPPWHQAV